MRVTLALLLVLLGYCCAASSRSGCNGDDFSIFGPDGEAYFTIDGSTECPTTTIKGRLQFDTEDSDNCCGGAYTACKRYHPGLDLFFDAPNGWTTPVARDSEGNPSGLGCNCRGGECGTFRCASNSPIVFGFECGEPTEERPDPASLDDTDTAYEAFSVGEYADGRLYFVATKETRVVASSSLSVSLVFMECLDHGCTQRRCEEIPGTESLADLNGDVSNGIPAWQFPENGENMRSYHTGVNPLGNPQFWMWATDDDSADEENDDSIEQLRIITCTDPSCTSVPVISSRISPRDDESIDDDDFLHYIVRDDDVAMFLTWDDTGLNDDTCGPTNPLGCYDNMLHIHECQDDVCTNFPIQHSFPLNHDDAANRIAFAWNSVIQAPQLIWTRDDESDDWQGIHLRTCAQEDCSTGFVDDNAEPKVIIEDQRGYFDPDDEAQMFLAINPETGNPIIPFAQGTDEYGQLIFNFCTDPYCNEYLTRDMHLMDFYRTGTSYHGEIQKRGGVSPSDRDGVYREFKVDPVTGTLGFSYAGDDDEGLHGGYLAFCTDATCQNHVNQYVGWGDDDDFGAWLMPHENGWRSIYLSRMEQDEEDDIIIKVCSIEQENHSTTPLSLQPSSAKKRAALRRKSGK